MRHGKGRHGEEGRWRESRTGKGGARAPGVRPGLQGPRTSDPTAHSRGHRVEWREGERRTDRRPLLAQLADRHPASGCPSRLGAGRDRGRRPRAILQDRQAAPLRCRPRMVRALRTLRRKAPGHRPRQRRRSRHECTDRHRDVSAQRGQTTGHAGLYLAANGPLTKAGRRRAVVGLYLEASTRVERLAARIGTDRRAKQVPSLAEVMADE